jgi:hypothetical protein
MTTKLTLLALLSLAGVAQAQFILRPTNPERGASSQPPPPAPTPPPAEPPPTPAQPKSLDDLLGLTPDKPAPNAVAKPAPPAVDPTRAELDKKLSPRDAADQFKQAVDLMGQTADRLQTSKDTGLATQRIQEDILRRLDMVIHSAQQQQQQSSSKSKQQQSPDQDQQGQQDQQQNQERQNASSNPAKDTINPPSRRDGALNPELTNRGQKWGDLPDRMREALLQGNSDKYSSLYHKYTEAYYRKLAEEGNK